jgi:hypothetical protein
MSLFCLDSGRRACNLEAVRAGNPVEEPMPEPRLEAVALWVLVMLLVGLTLALEFTVFSK